MKAREIDDYLMLGWYWASILEVQSGTEVHDDDYGVIKRIRHIFDFLEEFELNVTARAGAKVKEFMQELEKKTKDAELTPGEARRLSKLMSDWIQTLDAELKGRVAYQVTDKRFDIKKLLGNVGALMPPGVFGSLPEVAIFDFREAGKAIAFEMPTAAAFHLMRGTEAVLREFYMSTVKRDRVNPLLWGPMLQSLRGRTKPPPAALLDNLDNIRNNFRNPTQHPDAVYDIHEAQSLFGLCVDVVSRMVKILNS